MLHSALFLLLVFFCTWCICSALLILLFLLCLICQSSFNIIMNASFFVIFHKASISIFNLIAHCTSHHIIAINNNTCFSIGIAVLLLQPLSFWKTGKSVTQINYSQLQVGSFFCRQSDLILNFILCQPNSFALLQKYSNYAHSAKVTIENL